MKLDTLEDLNAFISSNEVDISGIILRDAGNKSGYELIFNNIDSDVEEMNILINLDGDDLSKIICKHLKHMVNLQILGLVHANMCEITNLPKSIEYIRINDFLGTDLVSFKKIIEGLPKLAHLSIENWMDNENSQDFLSALSLKGSYVKSRTDMSDYIMKFAHNTTYMNVRIVSKDIVIIYYSYFNDLDTRIKFTLVYKDAYKDIMRNILTNFHGMENLETLVIHVNSECDIEWSNENIEKLSSKMTKLHLPNDNDLSITIPENVNISYD